MKWQWCWRCEMDVPMLDEVEFARIQAVYVTLFPRRGDDAQPAASGPNPPDVREAGFPLERILDLYREMTGLDEPNPAAVMHHRLALYGPPCHVCEKPLRSPQARFCAACGATRVDRSSRS